MFVLTVGFFTRDVVTFDPLFRRILAAFFFFTSTTATPTACSWKEEVGDMRYEARSRGRSSTDPLDVLSLRNAQTIELSRLQPGLQFSSPSRALQPKLKG